MGDKLTLVELAQMKRERKKSVPVAACSRTRQPVGIDNAYTVHQWAVVHPTEHAPLLAEFPSGLIIMVTYCPVNALAPGMTISGHKATLNIEAPGGKAELMPPRE